MTKAFTLIELLVVVLIIGILSAVALPQYQKAVEKSKSAQAVTMLKSVYQAALEYQLANGTWPTSFDDLSVTPPWTGTQKWYPSNNVKQALSNDEWSIQLRIDNGYAEGLTMGRISGNYPGGGFAIWHTYTYYKSIPLNTLLCAEKISDITTPGDFCKKVMQSGDLVVTASTLRYYKMS